MFNNSPSPISSLPPHSASKSFTHKWAECQTTNVPEISKRQNYIQSVSTPPKYPPQTRIWSRIVPIWFCLMICRIFLRSCTDETFWQDFFSQFPAISGPECWLLRVGCAGFCQLFQIVCARRLPKCATHCLLQLNITLLFWQHGRKGTFEHLPSRKCRVRVEIFIW